MRSVSELIPVRFVAHEDTNDEVEIEAEVYVRMSSEYGAGVAQYYVDDVDIRSLNYGGQEISRLALRFFPESLLERIEKEALDKFNIYCDMQF